MRKTHNVIIVLAIAVALLPACWGGSSDENDSEVLPHDEAADLLIDRNWLDTWPQDKDERLHVYRFVPSMGGGVYQDRTLFLGQFELFTYEVDARRGVIEFTMPHNDQKVEARFRIEKVKGPKPFDLKLTIDPSPRGPEVYYGMTREGSKLDWLR